LIPDVLLLVVVVVCVCCFYFVGIGLYIFFVFMDVLNLPWLEFYFYKEGHVDRFLLKCDFIMEYVIFSTSKISIFQQKNHRLYWLVLCVNLTQAEVFTEKGSSVVEMHS